MKLSELLSEKHRKRDVNIAGLSADSRTVKPGFLFAALPGSQVDGADYIEAAIKAGAAAILCYPGAVRDNADVIWVSDPVPARLFAHMAARFFVQQPKNIAAVTGTNGKTSVASFTRQIWQYLGHKAAMVGTLGISGPGISQKTALTTPDPVTLQSAMKDICDAGIDHVVFEASSHGLAQYRLDGMNISVAAFTNLTRDHFDYHGDMESYYYAKARLFGEVMPPGGTAVLNADSPLVMEVADICWAQGHRIITVGHHSGDIRLLTQRASELGQDMTISYQGQIFDLTLPLVGTFQAMNALMAVGLVIASGGDVKKSFKALAYLKAVPGRLEQAGRHSSGARIYVDYAHTPDALESVLAAMRPHVKKTLSVVFGCGGDRDRGKRKIMGEVAAALADRIYVTDDNPRDEDAQEIRTEIRRGCPTATEIGDRRQAIEMAVSDLKKGDILLVAGKGHEQGQIIRGKIYPFNDMCEVRSAITAEHCVKPGERRPGI